MGYKRLTKGLEQAGLPSGFLTRRWQMAGRCKEDGRGACRGAGVLRGFLQTSLPGDCAMECDGFSIPVYISSMKWGGYTYAYFVSCPLPLGGVRF